MLVGWSSFAVRDFGPYVMIFMNAACVCVCVCVVV
jgi:hypothetical protein